MFILNVGECNQVNGLPKFLVHVYFNLAFKGSEYLRVKTDVDSLFLLGIKDESFPNKAKTLDVLIPKDVTSAAFFGL